MLPQNNPDRIRIAFDDHRLVANAGLLLPATLAWHLGLRERRHHLDLGGAPGRANRGDKMLTLVASALAGGDCIDDADALRAGGTAGVLGCAVKAPCLVHPCAQSGWASPRIGSLKQVEEQLEVLPVLISRFAQQTGKPGPRAWTSGDSRPSARTPSTRLAKLLQPLHEAGRSLERRPLGQFCAVGEQPYQCAVVHGGQEVD